MKDDNKITFAFDVGMTSLGVAVNEREEIIHADVLLMHGNAGSVKEQAGRRRMFRTREAHKDRETALESLWRSIGKEPLQRKRFSKAKAANGRKIFKKTKADERLEREFPAKGDNTVYASSLLRIMLIEDEQLEDWQIYKALNAAIQRRGYDKDVPWKARQEATEKEKKRSANKDENPEEQVSEFKENLQKMTPDRRYHLPCYYDAWKMGLWDNQEKKIRDIRQRLGREGINDPEGVHSRESPRKTGAGGYTASRELVTRELKQLLNHAARQISALADHLTDDKLNQLLYGNQENAIDKRYPSASKIDGLLGQKYPRFENRIVSKCALIPRLNVCKSEKELAIETGFLLRLVNWRYETEDGQGNKQQACLTGEELIQQFGRRREAWERKKEAYNPEKYAKCFKLTKAAITRVAEGLGGSVKTGHEEIPASKHSGRSRFCQPALYLLKDLILSEKTPHEFYRELSQAIKTKVAENPNAEFGYRLFDNVSYKYFSDDLVFLKKMGNSRDAIYIPDISLAERYINEDGDLDSAIQRVINSCNWPELRHRLSVFRQELENLVKKCGVPDAVHLEFIREDFLSDKKKRKYTEQSQAGSDKHKQAREELKKLDIDATDKNIRRYRLYKEQNTQCLYTGRCIDISNLESYQIDHIFPQEDGGPDAYYNQVLTSAEVNCNRKGKRLPCECDFINWAAFKTRLEHLDLGKNKKKLLLASTRKEAEALIKKYTGLAGTAHIARLARDIVCLRFGWQPGEKSEQQRVFVFSGGLTSKVAREYKLYRALGDGSMHFKKDRTDHRHHALDAMVISYLRQWARDKGKTDSFKLPKGIDASYFAEKLKEVYPHYITRTRPALEEQPKLKRNPGKDSKNQVDVKKFKNISKDPDEHGQWHTNKKKTGKGTSQHGYYFYKDNKGIVRSKTVHSFRSPYAVRKEVEKKAAEVLGLFCQKMLICLPDQDKITATRLGRNVRLPYGDYRIFKKNKEDIIIQDSGQRQDQSRDNDSPPGRYRISPADLKKISIVNQLMRGNPFDLDEFSVSKDKKLSGRYKVDGENSNLRDFFIIHTQTEEKEKIGFTALVNHLAKEDWSAALEKGDDVTIKKNHGRYIDKVTKDDIPKQKLPGGKYLIEGFANGAEIINLSSQNGTVYRVDSKVLEYAKQTD